MKLCAHDHHHRRYDVGLEDARAVAVKGEEFCQQNSNLRTCCTLQWGLRGLASRCMRETRADHWIGYFRNRFFQMVLSTNLPKPCDYFDLIGVTRALAGPCRALHLNLHSPLNSLLQDSNAWASSDGCRHYRTLRRSS